MVCFLVFDFAVAFAYTLVIHQVWDIILNFVSASSLTLYNYRKKVPKLEIRGVDCREAYPKRLKKLLLKLRRQ